jgi:alkanesulfonate monooxygenase SsuD/methylene tetrahydromethanopterin reductase-like flavin-dependent oxidoreductase (luciferase family)
LIFGVGRSGLPGPTRITGVTRRAATVSSSSRHRRAGVVAPSSYEGKYYSFKNISIAPKPLQKPYPSHSIAAASDTYPRSASAGCLHQRPPRLVFRLFPGDPPIP